jgi:hypothetical protein
MSLIINYYEFAWRYLCYIILRSYLRDKCHSKKDAIPLR